MASDIVADELERPRSHRENRKKNRGRKVGDDQAQAIAKFIRVQPRKARLVIDEIRGRYAEEAQAFLRFVPNRAAGYISKVLASAVANAANNHGLEPQNLKLVEARVDEGPRMKRVQPRAQGRAYRILKRTSHITIIVQEVEPRRQKPKKATGSRAQAARAAKQAPAAARPPVAEPIVETPAAVVPAAVEDRLVVAATPEPIVETPVETTNSAIETASAAEFAPEVANTEDRTDEIGAPIDNDAASE